MKTQKLELIVSIDNLISVTVDAPLFEGEPDWDEATKILMKKAPEVIKCFIESLNEADMIISISDQDTVIE